MGRSYLVLYSMEVIVEDEHFLKEHFSSIKGSIKYIHMRKGDILKDLYEDKAYGYYDTFSIIANTDGLDFDSDIEYYVEGMVSFNNKSFLNNIQSIRYPEIEIPFSILPKYIGKKGLDQELIHWRLKKGC